MFLKLEVVGSNTRRDGLHFVLLIYRKTCFSSEVYCAWFFPTKFCVNDEVNRGPKIWRIENFWTSRNSNAWTKWIFSKSRNKRFSISKFSFHLDKSQRAICFEFICRARLIEFFFSFLSAFISSFASTIIRATLFLLWNVSNQRAYSLILLKSNDFLFP